jgi:hypothetical protein
VRGQCSSGRATRSVAEDVVVRGHWREEARLSPALDGAVPAPAISCAGVREGRSRDPDVDAMLLEPWAGPAVHMAWQGRRRGSEVRVVDDHVVASRFHLLISVQKRRRWTSEDPRRQRLRLRHHWRSWGFGLGA